MAVLQGKKILLGITGSIAAYKAAALTRLFVKAGAEVQVIMTEAAMEFITPLTLATLSKKPALHAFKKNDVGEWSNHVDLGLWADVILVAPASANTLSKMASGLCDNLLAAVYLSSRCPIFVAPAMDLDMYSHPSTLSNLKTLASYGCRVIEATHGELASGLVGQGRMAEPEQIFECLEGFFADSGALEGKHVMVTAGPTYEAIDPVRYISNHSSGKMGYALAEAAAYKGAKVTLISGPTHLQVEHPSITKVAVMSADEMYQACVVANAESDINILAAAVADYKPEHTHEHKIKKKEAKMTMALSKTKDIAKALGQDKREGQFTVGFALETENEQANAQAKLVAKNFDMIVLNSLQDAGAGFGHDTNKVTLIAKDNKTTEFELKSKQQVAADIIEAIITRTNA